MAFTVHARALARAAQLLGGVAALSEFVQAPQPELMRWIGGEVLPPTNTFNDVVEFLLQADSHISDDPNSKLPQIPSA